MELFALSFAVLLKSIASIYLLFAVVASTVAPLRAAIVINIVESGSDVVAALSGSINSLSGATLHSAGTAAMFNGVRPSGANPIFGFSVSSASSTFRTVNYYSVPIYPTNFGFGTNYYRATPTSVSTYMVFRGVAPQTVYLDQTYVLGTPVTGTLTWAGQSFATLGLDQGSYVWSWTGDSITLNIGSTSAVPEPGPWAAAALLVGGAAFLRRRKRAKVS